MAAGARANRDLSLLMHPAASAFVQLDLGVVGFARIPFGRGILANPTTANPVS